MSERYIFCGLEPHGNGPKDSRILHAHGPKRNITLDKLTISRRLAATIEPRLLDLIDLGAYVFAADRILSRGHKSEAGMAPKWRRQLNFEIAVRDPGHWSKPEIKLLLQDALGFMSDDEFTFKFSKAREVAPETSYFTFHDDPITSGDIAPVILFSGGLDSLAGVLEELRAGRRRLILVSHQSSTLVTHHQNRLAAELKKRHPGRILHIPVKMTLFESQAEEDSQRTRTFFFSCIAGAVAAAIGAPGIRYYENGVMSLNLPVSDQVSGAAATRSTHPRTLMEVAYFLGAAIGRACSADNPFVYKTKAQVISTLVAASGAELIDLAFTCTAVQWRSENKSHCGACIQCLHRLFGMLAAEQADKDAPGKYALDLFESPREGRDRTMLVALVRRARQYHRMRDADEFFSAFPLELSRLRGALGPANEAVREMFELHRRFGEEIAIVIEQGLGRYKSQLSRGLMVPGTLLSFVVGEQSGDKPETVPVPLRSPASSSQIELMIDVEAGNYSINGRKPLRGKTSTRFLALLADLHRKDAHVGGQRVRYLATGKLSRLIPCEPQSLTRLVERLRDRVAAELTGSGIEASRRDAVIQTRKWQGYRLNPSVRLIDPPA